VNFNKKELPSITMLLFIGAVIGGSIAVGYNNHQIAEIQEELQDANTVNINTDQPQTYPDLFEQVEKSVVTVNSFEGEGRQGSGFVYSEDGYIITNYHVIQERENIEVTISDGSTETADIVGEDPYTDLAVLKIESNDLRPLELGDLNEVEITEPVIAVGNPFGFESSVSSGIVSQKDRLLPLQGGFSIPNVLQTDAAINPGNSGGPLLNMKGEVIGVNTAIETRTGTSSGVGFAIPVETVERVVPELIDNGEYEHAWLGISGVDVGPEIADAMDLEENTGFLVAEVVEEGPSDDKIIQGDRSAEIRGEETLIGGDVIKQIDDQKVRGIEDVLVYLARHTEPGHQVELEIIRDGDRETIDITLDSRPEVIEQDNEE